MSIRSLKDIPNGLKCDQKVPDVFAQQHPNVLFAGRLGQYEYMDMDETMIKESPMILLSVIIFDTIPSVMQ